MIDDKVCLLAEKIRNRQRAEIEERVMRLEVERELEKLNLKEYHYFVKFNLSLRAKRSNLLFMIKLKIASALRASQ